MTEDDEGKEAFIQLMADRLQRMPGDTAPTGQPYHVLEAVTETGELTGMLWMSGPPGAIPVFQSREDCTAALRYAPAPREAGYGEDAVRWEVRGLSGDELRYLYLKPDFTLYVVLAVRDEGIDVQKL
jgi:hypothetical protein